MNTPTVLAIGTEVIATYYNGAEVRGTITERSWFFERLDFYTVREAADGRAWCDVPEYRIYPPRDAIRPA